MEKFRVIDRHFLGVAGTIGAVEGIMIMIPSIIKENYIGTSLAEALVIIGIILLAIA